MTILNYGNFSEYFSSAATLLNLGWRPAWNLKICCNKIIQFYFQKSCYELTCIEIIMLNLRFRSHFSTAPLITVNCYRSNCSFPKNLIIAALSNGVLVLTHCLPITYPFLITITRLLIAGRQLKERHGCILQRENFSVASNLMSKLLTNVWSLRWFNSDGVRPIEIFAELKSFTWLKILLKYAW